MSWVNRGSSTRFRLICVGMFVDVQSDSIFVRSVRHSFIISMLTLFGFEPLQFLVYVVISLSLFCYIYGTATNNVSQVDRLWSIYPFVLCWIYTYASSFSPVALMMTICITIWGCRLTYNFYIKGGFSFKNGVFTDEDYRWGILRRNITNPLLWNLFHIFFICIFQITLLTGITYPVLVVAMENSALTPTDCIFISVFLFFLIERNSCPV